MRRAVVVLALVGCGCMARNPTRVETPPYEHPNEALMYGRLQCNAQLHKVGAVELIYFATRQWVTRPDGSLGIIACVAPPASGYVRCDRPWLQQATALEIAETAAHEVCHLAGDLHEPPLACMLPALEKCGG